MGRFLPSSLAGILVIAGGWFGWTGADHDVSPDRDHAGPEPHRPRLDGITLP